MEQEVILTVDKNNIATLTLNRPHVHNAINSTMIRKLTDTLDSLHNKPSIRLLIIEGNGKSFCAGADLIWMKNFSEYKADENVEDVAHLSVMLELLNSLPMPILSYVHGGIMGGGIGLIACSDIVLADPHAFFSFSEIKLGLIPAIISPYVLRIIGTTYARRYFLTGERFDAPAASRIGLVHEIIALEKKKEGVDKFIQHILRGAPQAIKKAKKLIHDLSEKTDETTRIMTLELIAAQRLSKEAQEGVDAFLNKTSPSWVPPGLPND